MILGRFVLRLLLVPLGWCFAMSAAGMFIIIANRASFIALANASPDQQANWIVFFTATAPLLMFALGASLFWMVGLAAIGILFSETFALRSWVFHAANGAIAAWLGWYMLNNLGDEYRFIASPTIIVAAGLVAGLAYWAIAGWSAGFWKPVFRHDTLVPPDDPA
jgi:hypothetical protein